MHGAHIIKRKGRIPVAVVRACVTLARHISAYLGQLLFVLFVHFLLNKPPEKHDINYHVVLCFQRECGCRCELRETIHYPHASDAGGRLIALRC